MEYEERKNLWKLSTILSALSLIGALLTLVDSPKKPPRINTFHNQESRRNGANPISDPYDSLPGTRQNRNPYTHPNIPTTRYNQNTYPNTPSTRYNQNTYPNTPNTRYNPNQHNPNTGGQPAARPNNMNGYPNTGARRKKPGYPY